MSIEIVVRDGAVERILGPADLPIAFRADGALADATAADAAAFLGVHDDHAFVQPAREDVPILVAGRRVEASRWIDDGDEIRIAAARLRCNVDAARLVVLVERFDEAPTLVPPSEPPPERRDRTGVPAADGSDPVGSVSARPLSPAPISGPSDGAFRSASEAEAGEAPPRVAPPTVEAPPDAPTPETPARSAEPDAAVAAPTWRHPLRAAAPRGVRATLLAAFTLLVGAALFVFFAASVEIRIEPAPEILDLDGPVPDLTIAGRRLMLPGEYVLRAERTGYRVLETRIGVEGGRSNAFEFALEKLPGRVTIRTTPRDDVEIAIDGVEAGTTPLDALELSAGPHAIVARAERHLDANVTVDVEGLDRPQSIDVELVPAWATVSFASAPEDAAVRVDGVVLGHTPLSVDLDAGMHSIEIEKPAYETHRETIRVEPDVPLAVRAVVLVPAAGRLALETAPSGATVTIDGAYRGTTPLELALAPNEAHAISIRLAGHIGSDRRITLAPDESRLLAIELAARVGAVLVTAMPPDAELIVDGRSLGDATRRLELPARAHAFVVRKEGYVPFETTVTPRPGVSQRLDVVLEREARAAPRTLATAEGQPLVRVEPARLAMGASRREPGRRGNESQRLVAITRPFLIGAREVTNAEFRRFRPEHRSGAAGGESLDADTQPVVSVTWADAARYLNWLSKRDGLVPAYAIDGESVRAVRPPGTGYRLPTEAEWALVARFAGAPEPRRYPWGGGFPPPEGAGNYADASASALLANVVADYRDGFAASAPVASFPANPLGIFDLGGNVAEWCHDHYAVYPDARDTYVNDPIGPETGKHYVVRGSSWRHSSISALRTSYRDYSAQSRDDLGFRVARYVE